MFFSNKEKKIMEKLFIAINEDKNEIYVITFTNGDVVEAKVDTCYETNNGLEDDDMNFEEYYACAMRIVKVVINRSNTLENGKLIEINYHNYPQEIKKLQGDII